MITAEFDFNMETLEASLIVRGHASFAEIGTDIVCASASILTYTIAEIVQQMEEKRNMYSIRTTVKTPEWQLWGFSLCVRLAAHVSNG